MQPSILNDEETLKLPAIQTKPASTIETSSVRISWFEALKQVTPIYIATHIVFLVMTYLAALFSLKNFLSNSLPLSTLLQSWYRWDSGQFTAIATNGYDSLYRMAFFPLFPLLERALAVVVRDPFVAGLIISNTVTIGLLMVFYRLVAEDFTTELAWRSVLYLAIFPTAFFFATAYNESLFILFVLLSFYSMRKGHWWLAGLFALFASLTRSIAVCLVVPFIYEYMRQRGFQWRKVEFNILSALGIVGGIVIFGFYGYLTYHDFLAFSHAQKVWGRQLAFPWTIFLRAAGAIIHHPFLSFGSIHASIDLSAALFILAALVLSFVGPWKLAKEHWSYALYAATLYLFVILVPESGGLPLASLSRFMLEIFPAFIMLATLGKKRNFNMYYLSICGPLLAFMLLQWLTGGWIV